MMMNIKVKYPISENEVEVTMPCGSRVYGTANENSDYDFVKITKQDTGSLVLQYSTLGEGFTWDAVDYLYTGLKNFLDQAESGANTIFFECMHTKEFQNYWCPPKHSEWDNAYLLYKMYNPWVAKAYLGLAKRDIRFPERAHHVRRCYWMANKILKKELIDLSEVKNIPDTPITLEQIQELRKSIIYPS